MQQYSSSHLRAVKLASLANFSSHLLDFCRYSASQGLISTALTYIAGTVGSTFPSEYAQLNMIKVAHESVQPVKVSPKGQIRPAEYMHSQDSSQCIGVFEYNVGVVIMVQSLRFDCICACLASLSAANGDHALITK